MSFASPSVIWLVLITFVVVKFNHLFNLLSGIYAELSCFWCNVRGKHVLIFYFCVLWWQADYVSEGKRVFVFGILSGVVSGANVCGTLTARLLPTARIFQAILFLIIS